jgi:hypothetical protein
MRDNWLFKTPAIPQKVNRELTYDIVYGNMCLYKIHVHTKIYTQIAIVPFVLTAKNVGKDQMLITDK